jgi:hypothetical protein
VFKIGKILNFARLLASICGGWWSLMSGAISIPFTFMALLTNGHPKKYFALLAFVALWVIVVRTTWKNYQILSIQRPEKNRALLATMVDHIKSQKHVSSGDMMKDYWKSLQPVDSIGAVIKFSDEIQTEDELKWFCDEFAKLEYAHPLKNFQPVLEDGFQWLPVLREAKLKQREIRTEIQFLQFLAINWSGKEKWKLGQARILANKQIGNV